MSQNTTYWKARALLAEERERQAMRLCHRCLNRAIAMEVVAAVLLCCFVVWA